MANAGICDQFNTQYDALLSAQGLDPEEYKFECSDKVAIGLAMICGLASFIIGSLALSGTLPVSTAGWCLLGLSCASFAAAFISQMARKHPLITVITLLTFLALPIIVGGVAGGGMLTATQFGWIIIGPAVAFMGLSVLLGCCGGCCGCCIAACSNP